MLANHSQDTLAVRLAGQLHAKVGRLQGEQAREELSVVDIRAVSRIAIRARAGVHPEALPLLGGEALEHQIVQVDETLQQAPTRVQLDRQPPFGEVHLDHMGAHRQTTPNFTLLLSDQGIEILFA